MRLFVRICLILILSGVWHGLYAQLDEYQVNIHLWSTSGNTNWRHDASKSFPDLGVPTSELDYQNADSEIIDISLLTEILDNQKIRLGFGVGEINSGRMVDDDYYSAEGADRFVTTVSGHHRYSRTYSDIDNGNLFYLKAEILPDNWIFNLDRGQVRINLAAQYWQERYHAYGLLTVECTDPDGCSPPGTFNYAGVNVISNTVQWLSFGMAIEGFVEPLPSLQLFINTTLYPLVSLNNEDIHHLRSDLAQNPSIRMTGMGYGYDLDLGLRYMVSEQFSVNLGYRRWQREVKNQTITFFGASGGRGSYKLIDLSTTRDGFMLGVEYKL